MSSIFDYSMTTANGGSLELSSLRGRVILIANTASQCGFTPQYRGMEELYQSYKDQGLMVLAFPCNQFGKQEPLTSESLVEYCEINHGVTFPISQRVDVNGREATPIFRYLKTEKGGLLGGRIKWNFTKFLIDRSGQVTHRFSPLTAPHKIRVFIEEALLVSSTSP